MIDEAAYMRRALELAALGLGQTSPNPMVGAVLVAEGRIIGEGYHHQAGQAHAEVMAVANVASCDRPLLREATLYVTLEPCSHYGKTPPCCSLIEHEGIPRVVIAMEDPFPEVSGRGIARLRAAGCSVELGLLEEEARRLNAPFILTHTEGRPWVTLKWAQSTDGFIDRHRSSSAEPAELFSGPLQLRLVHAARAHHDAILVGYRTALLDDPLLNNRLWWGKSPTRVVLDPRLELPEQLRLFHEDSAPTLVLHLEQALPQRPTHHAPHVRYHAVAAERLSPELILRTLHSEGIQSVLIEGGAATLTAFLSAGLYDDLCIEVSPRLLFNGVKAPCCAPTAHE